jgi:hypothetical protein
MSGEIADGLVWDWTATLVGIKLLMKYVVHYSDTRREGCQRLRMMNCRYVCSNDFSNDHSGRFNWFVTNWLVLISHLVIPSVIWSDRVTLSVAKKGLLDMVPCLMLGGYDPHDPMCHGYPQIPKFDHPFPNKNGNGVGHLTSFSPGAAACGKRSAEQVRMTRAWCLWLKFEWNLHETHEFGCGNPAFFYWIHWLWRLNDLIFTWC